MRTLSLMGNRGVQSGLRMKGGLALGIGSDHLQTHGYTQILESTRTPPANYLRYIRTGLRTEIVNR
jgi:hypothetical protein